MTDQPRSPLLGVSLTKNGSPIPDMDPQSGATGERLAEFLMMEVPSRETAREMLAQVDRVLAGQAPSWEYETEKVFNLAVERDQASLTNDYDEDDAPAVTVPTAVLRSTLDRWLAALEGRDA